MNVRILCYECMRLIIPVINFLFSVENERESYFRYDGSSTQEGH